MLKRVVHKNHLSSDTTLTTEFQTASESNVITRTVRLQVIVTRVTASLPDYNNEQYCMVYLQVIVPAGYSNQGYSIPTRL